MMFASGIASRANSSAAPLSAPPEVATTTERLGAASRVALRLALRLAFFDRLALVILLLAASEPEFSLDHTALEVQAQRHQRQSFLLQLADEPCQLARV